MVNSTIAAVVIELDPPPVRGSCRDGAVVGAAVGAAVEGGGGGGFAATMLVVGVAAAVVVGAGGGIVDVDVVDGGPSATRIICSTAVGSACTATMRPEEATVTRWNTTTVCPASGASAGTRNVTATLPSGVVGTKVAVPVMPVGIISGSATVELATTTGKSWRAASTPAVMPDVVGPSATEPEDVSSPVAGTISSPLTRYSVPGTSAV
jgi:hypothetical protein